MRTVSFALLAALTCIACADDDVTTDGFRGAELAPVEQAQTLPDSAREVTGQPLARLERTGCFGFCPVYTVTFYDSGVVEIVGIRNVARPGLVQASLTASAIDRVDQAFQTAHFAQMDDVYDSGQQDAPWAIVTWWTDRGPITVRHNLASDAPEKLLDLEDKLDALANVDRFLGEGLFPAQKDPGDLGL